MATCIPNAQAELATLGSYSIYEGPAAGSDSVALFATSPAMTWTNTTSDSWLHLSPANQSGTGSTNVSFSFDANPGPTRTGKFIIAGNKLLITQAGANFAADGTVANITAPGAVFNPNCLAIDAARNVYIADTQHSAIKKWSPANNTLTTLFSGINFFPLGVAVDSLGNVYFNDSYNKAIYEWRASDSNLITLVSSGLGSLYGVVADSQGNVLYTDNSSIKEWNASSSNVTTLITGLSAPSGLAMDHAGNVYIADSQSFSIKLWTAASSNLTTLVSGGLNSPTGVAVDGSGNVYIADYFNSAIKKWVAASNTVVTLVGSGLSQPAGVAVDNVGNLYIADTSHSLVKELPRAFVDTTGRAEPVAGGTDVLYQVVLPESENLSGPFTPTSDSAWLTSPGTTNQGIIISFGSSTSNRTGNLTVLGQTIPVYQLTPIIGTTNRLEGPVAGSDSVPLSTAASDQWTNTANAAWLHLNAANLTGTGPTNIVFSFDQNNGATRTGTLTIHGFTVTVTQAGATYGPSRQVTTLASGLNNPSGAAVDGAGNMYFVDTGSTSIKKWTLTNNTVTTLVSAGLNTPGAVAVDGAGNVYIADGGNNAIKKWTATNGSLTTLVSSGLNAPGGVAVDGSGNVYIADSQNSAIKKWNVNSSTVTTVISGLAFFPSDVAVDFAGNLYLPDGPHQQILKWTPANSTLTPLISMFSFYPTRVAVDGAGNVYFTDTLNDTIDEWNAATGTVSQLATSLSQPYGVAVDRNGNVYFSDVLNNFIKEIVYAFVDLANKTEPSTSGSDGLATILPASQNLLAPFNPVSDSPWLTISGINNGIVNFSFTTTTSNRAGHVILLGYGINVSQPLIATPPYLTGLQLLSNRALRFSFTNNPNATFTVLSTTNPALSVNQWTVLGAPTNIGSGVFQYVTQPLTNGQQRYFRVRSP